MSEEREPTCAENCAASLRTKYRPSDSVLREYGRWKAPNEDEARKKFLAEHTHHQIFDVSAPCKELKEFGTGILLYFYLLRNTALLFAVLALLPGLPLVIFNGIGGWYDRADLERTMLGNFGLLSYDGRSSDLNITTSASTLRTGSTEGSVTALFMSTINTPAAKVGGMDKRNLLVAMSALDLVGVLAFFFYCLYMIWYVRAVTKKAELHSTTIADYSLRVCRLPPDTSDEALKQYLTAAVAAGTQAAAAAAAAKSAKDAAAGAAKGGKGGKGEGGEGDGGEGGGGGGGEGGQDGEGGKGDAMASLEMGMGMGGEMGGEMGTGGEVVQVELCRKVDCLIGLVLERDGVLVAGETALAVLQRSAEVYPKVPLNLEVNVLDARFRLSDLNEAIRAEQAAADTNQVVTAFVTFSTPEARRRVMEALPRSRMRQWRTPPEHKFGNGGIGSAAVKPVALDVSPAPEPSDVQYENLEYGPLNRFVRVCATNAAKYIVLLIGFLLVSLAPALRLGMSASGEGPSRATCDASCSYTDAAGNYVLTAANRELYASCDPVDGPGTLPGSVLDCEAVSVCYECFCRAALNAGAYGEMGYCGRFDSVVAISTLAQALAVFGVVLANMMIQYAIGWLTRQEKHHTRSREAVSTARGLFITQFVNTAFSNLVANMFLPGPASAIKGSFLGGYILTGPYADTTPNWYHDVGRPIIISMALNTAILHAKILFQHWWRRYRMSRRYACLTQRQLEQAFAGPEFRLADKYGHHLYVIFVIMTYSSCMPLLYILAAVHFGTAYWSEKYELLRICKRPLSFSNDLARYASTTLPFAALWHLAFGIWAFSLFGTPASPVVASGFRKSLARTFKSIKGLMAADSTLTPDSVAWRLTQNSSGHLFIAFLFCGAVLFIFFTLSGWLAAMRWLASLLGCSRDTGAAGEPAEESPAPEFGTAVRSALLVGPGSYSVQRNPAYAFAFAEMEEFEWERPESTRSSAVLQADDGMEGSPATARPSGAFGAAADGADAAAGGGAGRRTSRRKRSVAARMRARRQAEAAAAAGWPDVKRNQVAPEPGRPPPQQQLGGEAPAGQDGGSGAAPGAGAFPSGAGAGLVQALGALL